MKRNLIGKCLGVVAFCLGANIGVAQDSSAPKTFSELVGHATAKPVKMTTPLKIPFITWGGDVATFYANGGLKTTKDSIYGKLGLNLELTAGDDFVQQVKDYMDGKSPFLRGTFSMIGLASEVIGSSPDTKGVVVMQMTWSNGDHMVAREDVPDIKSLKGKTVVLQAGGPHVGMLNDILRTTDLKWTDIKVRWAKDLTASENSPVTIFQKDPTVGACFVITPDMITLTSGLNKTGSGAEGSVKGAHVIASTGKGMTRSIADVYVCRQDFYKQNRDLVLKFVGGYLKACEELVPLRDKFEDKSISATDKVKYMGVLKLSQDIYTKEVLPDLEQAAHGLLLDAEFVGYPGNWRFFGWGQGNEVGFEAMNKRCLELATSLGYATQQKDLITYKNDWDDTKIKSSLADTKKPLMSEGDSEGPLSVVVDNKRLGEKIYDFAVGFAPNESSFRGEEFSGPFRKVIDNAAVWGMCVIKIRGHADTMAFLKNTLEAGIELGKIRKQNNAFVMDGKPIDLENTTQIISWVKEKRFEGAANAQSPLDTLTAVEQLSKDRAEMVKKEIVNFAKTNGLALNSDHLLVDGAGISAPKVRVPTNREESGQNRRVEFEIRAIKAETEE